MKKFFIRLLNSPLAGCEFELPTGRTLVVVGQLLSRESAQHPQPDSETGSIINLPADTLYIPMDQPGVNFEIVINDEEAVIRKLLVSEQATTSEAVTVQYNTRQTVGALVFALRSDDMAWEEEVLGTLPVVTDDISSPLAKPVSPVVRKRRYIIPALVMMALFATTGAGWYGFKVWSNPQKQVKSLVNLLASDKHNLFIKKGTDNIVYVVSYHLTDTNWAQQAIMRNNYSKPYKVIYTGSENKRIRGWLTENYPSLAWYRIQLANPEQPQLWLSRQRTALDSASVNQLTAKLQQLMPYADKVKIVFVDDNTAVNQAKDGLLRLGLPYQIKRAHDVITFFIHGDLGDDELLRAYQLVNNYYQQWGRRYVQFDIKLRNSEFSGDSVSTYGDEGYVKVGTNHWYFSDK